MSEFLGGIKVVGQALVNEQTIADQPWVLAQIAAINASDHIIDTTHETLADYIANEDLSAVGEKAVLFLTQGSKGAQNYMRHTLTNEDETDFVNLDKVLTEAEVEAMLSAGEGLSYSAGEYSVADGGISQTKLDSTLQTAIFENTPVKFDIVGDGTTTSFPIVHNAGTLNIHAPTLRRVSDGKLVQAEYFATDVNTLTVQFSVAPLVDEDYVICMAKGEILAP